MSAFDGQEVRRRYGNWRKPRTRGLGALGTIPTMFGFGGAVVVILVAYAKGLLAAIMTAVVLGAILALVAIRDKHGSPGWSAS